MKRVVIRAPLLSASGYGVHSRQIARWLLAKHDAGEIDLTMQPVQWGITPWYLEASAKDGLIGRILSLSKATPTDKYDVSFQVQLPNEWDVNLASYNVGVTAGVETTVCNPAWIGSILKMQHVVVPSEFIRANFERASTEKLPVSVVSEAYFDCLTQTSENNPFSFDTAFNFLVIGQLTSSDAETDRKNTFNTLKWFCETFTGDKEVGLILKTNGGRDSLIDRRYTNNVVRQVLEQVRKGPYPRVHLLHGMMDDAEMTALYKHPSVKGLLTLTRGEGFGLPILEAAAADVPVLATGWSGHLDYMKLGKFIKFDFELKQIPASRVDKNIFMADAKWAEVNESDVKRKLMKFRERPSIPSEWAQALGPRVRESFSFSSISKRYDDLWQEIK